MDKKYNTYNLIIFAIGELISICTIFIGIHFVTVNLLNILLIELDKKIISLIVIDILALILSLYLKDIIILKFRKIDKDKITDILKTLLIASYIIIAIFTVFISLKYHIVLNDTETIFFKGTIINTDILNENIKLVKLENLQLLCKIVLIVTLTFSSIIVILEKLWINKLINITDEEKKKQKPKMKIIYIIALIVILLEIICLIFSIYSVHKTTVEIKVFIEKGITQEEVEELKNKISNIKQVKEVEYIEKAETLQQLENIGISKNILSGYENSSSISTSFSVKVNKEDVEVVKNEIKKIQNVENVN